MELSARTKSYVEAMVREGDNFDREKWLREVRAEEERQKLQLAATRPAAKDAPPILPLAGSAPVRPKDIVVLRASPPSELAIVSSRETPSLEQDIEILCDAWGDGQETRRRDAIYDFLRCVFCLVRTYQSHRKLCHLIRCAQKRARLPVDGNAEPYSVLLRAASGGTLDLKTVSKYSRVLRFAGRHKKDQPLTKFIKSCGGLNGCAARFADDRRRKRKVKQRRPRNTMSAN
jgi:hypothetical protein